MFSFHLGPKRASGSGAPRKRRPGLWARQTVLNVGLVCLAAGAVGGKQLLLRFSAFALVNCQAPQVINLKLTDLYMSGGMTSETFRVEWDGLPGATFYAFRNGTQVGPITTTLTNNGSVQHGVLLDTFVAQSGTTYTYSVEQIMPPPPPYSYGACNPTLSYPVTIRVVPVQAVVVDNQSVDARYDPRYALWVHLNHNFGSSATGQYVTNLYRGGLFAGYNGDNATVGHAYLSFPLPLLTTAGQDVARRRQRQRVLHDVLRARQHSGDLPDGAGRLEQHHAGLVQRARHHARERPCRSTGHRRDGGERGVGALGHERRHRRRTRERRLRGGAGRAERAFHGERPGGRLGNRVGLFLQEGMCDRAAGLRPVCLRLSAVGASRRSRELMKTILTPRRTAASLAGLAVLGGGAWLAVHHQARHRAAPRLIYTANGYGGFLPAPTAPKTAGKASKRVIPIVTRAKLQAPPVQVASEAYAAGRYGEVEAAAALVVRQAVQQPTLPHRRAAARAGSLLAYAAARRHDLTLARIRFATARLEAAALPDKGRQPARIGESPATLEEDDAFQHAVCTGALGDRPAAEAEYVAFMRRYPDSPLVQASVKRIARLHGGDVPPADEAVWREAMGTARKHQAARQREASVCGPECLAELLRRRGEAADVPGLAREMGTGENGTVLAALAAVAQKHGFRAQGLALTQKGLAETLAARRLPVIALVAPGHYVLVEAASPAGVTLWDPDARGVGQGDRRSVPSAQWQHQWRGVTLALAPVSGKIAAVQTARR